MMLTHQLIKAALLLWMTTISASYNALFASFRLERATTSPLSTRHQNNRRRRSRVTTAVGYDEQPSPPPRHYSIGHKRHSFEIMDRKDRWNDEERLGIMTRFFKGGVSSVMNLAVQSPVHEIDLRDRPATNSLFKSIIIYSPAGSIMFSLHSLFWHGKSAYR